MNPVTAVQPEVEPQFLTLAALRAEEDRLDWLENNATSRESALWQKVSAFFGSVMHRHPRRTATATTL